MSTSKTPKNAIIYNCEKCDFICKKKSEWDRHNQTKKHLGNINGVLVNKINKKNADIEGFVCETCNKIYKCRTGLWRHHKRYINNNCLNTTPADKENNISTDLSNNEVSILTNLVLELIKSNNNIQTQMLELCKNNNNNNTFINTNNSHNKTFNLQVFLNEECKNAMNMSEFINSLQLKLSDLENIGKIGYIEGMTNIIIKQLNGTDTYIRPVHCSDLKREILYIKEENKWEKEGPDNKKMKNALRHIEQKNFKMLNEWQAKHPHFKECTSSENDTYLQIVSKATNGTPENMNKVIKKVLKNIVIEKNVM